MKVLLVRLSSMGDLIHTLPAVHDLAAQRPDIELHWLCEAGFADIARLHPFVAKGLPMRWRQWRKQLWQSNTHKAIGELVRTLRTERYDLVLDSQGLLKSALFAKLAQAPIAGLDRHSARESVASFAYRYRYAVAKGQDAVLRNRQLFAQAFGYTFDTPPKFGIRVPPHAQPDGLPPQYHVALHATSRDSKLWPHEHWLQLLQRLHAHDGLPVLLPWGNTAERERAERMAQALPFAHVCPKLNLLQAAAMLQNADTVIGVDTGLLHLANAADKPIVGIYTDSDPVKTGVQPSAYTRNLGSIGIIPDPDSVFDAVQHCRSQKYR